LVCCTVPTTGFLAYRITATDMETRAVTVCRVRGIPRRGQLSIAVMTSSNAEANAFRIEFSFWRERLVMMPRTALLRMRMRTRGLAIEEREGEVKALCKSPLAPSRRTLHRMESRYMNTFCIMISISAPFPLIRYSLYTPANTEQRTCVRMNRKPRPMVDRVKEEEVVVEAVVVVVEVEAVVVVPEA